jgi:hypothetical protein
MLIRCTIYPAMLVRPFPTANRIGHGGELELELELEPELELEVEDDDDELKA